VHEPYVHHVLPVAADRVRVRFIGDLDLADGEATLTEAMVGSSEDLQYAVLTLSSQPELGFRNLAPCWPYRTHG
jgi:hypothetical protein